MSVKFHRHNQELYFSATLFSLIRIATYYNQFDAELAMLKLEEKAIFCFLRNEYLAQLQFGIAHFDLMVKEEDKELALHYLESDAADLDKSIEDLNES